MNVSEVDELQFSIEVVRLVSDIESKRKFCAHMKKKVHKSQFDPQGFEENKRMML